MIARRPRACRARGWGKKVALNAVAQKDQICPASPGHRTSCPDMQIGGSLRTGRGLPRSLSVIGMLARRVPYRLGAVDNGSAWMGDVVQARPVMARIPRGLRPEAEKQLSGGAIRRAIGRRAMMPSARGRPHTL